MYVRRFRCVLSSRHGLLLTTAGVVGKGLPLKLRSCFAQGGQPILEFQFLEQLIAPLANAVARVFLGDDQLGLAQQHWNHRLPLDLDFEQPLVAHGLSLDALTLSLVPAKASCPGTPSGTGNVPEQTTQPEQAANGGGNL